MILPSSIPRSARAGGFHTPASRAYFVQGAALLSYRPAGRYLHTCAASISLSEATRYRCPGSGTADEEKHIPPARIGKLTENIILAIMLTTSYHPSIMKQDKLADYSFQLAHASMEYAQHLKGYGAKKDQFLRAASAVGANIAEAKYGNGPADFVNKLHTALKESNETKFWLELFTPETEEQAEALKRMKRLNGNIMRMLIQSINTVKARPDWKR